MRHTKYFYDPAQIRLVIISPQSEIRDRRTHVHLSSGVGFFESGAAADELLERIKKQRPDLFKEETAPKRTKTASK